VVVVNGFLTMTYRQLKRFVNARSRLMMSIINPIIWLVFFVYNQPDHMVGFLRPRLE